jgi:hypothetical protein
MTGDGGDRGECSLPTLLACAAPTPPLIHYRVFLACKFKLFVLYVPGTGIQPVGPTPDPQLLRTVSSDRHKLQNYFIH